MQTFRKRRAGLSATAGLSCSYCSQFVRSSVCGTEIALCNFARRSAEGASLITEVKAKRNFNYAKTPTPATAAAYSSVCIADRSCLLSVHLTTDHIRP